MSMVQGCNFRGVANTATKSLLYSGCMLPFADSHAASAAVPPAAQGRGAVAVPHQRQGAQGGEGQGGRQAQEEKGAALLQRGMLATKEVG